MRHAALVWYGCNSSAARERAMKAMTGAVYLKFEFPERRCAVGVRGPGTAAGPRSNDDHDLGDSVDQRRVLSS